MFAAVMAATASAVHAQAPAPASAPKPAQIDRNGVLILVRSTLLALDQANKTGNYTVLRDLGAPGFQGNTAARLAEIFAKLRNDNLDLSGVAVIDPQLNLLPQIEANGLMRMAGFFPSVPAAGQFRSVVRAGERSVAAVRHIGLDRTERTRGAAPPSPPAAPKQPPAKQAAPAKSHLRVKLAPPESKPADSQQPK